jgi:hypothetical protein
MTRKIASSPARAETRKALAAEALLEAAAAAAKKNGEERGA